ncbi:Serine palmitoyltransferase 2 [Branchiostoma belcheri]|nr:Serine palmitoyltransferase 2 [Branchiostoma belcheri]
MPHHTPPPPLLLPRPPTPPHRRNHDPNTTDTAASTTRTAAHAAHAALPTITTNATTSFPLPQPSQLPIIQMQHLREHVDLVPQHIREGTKEEQRSWLHEKVGEIPSFTQLRDDRIAVGRTFLSPRDMQFLEIQIPRILTTPGWSNSPPGVAVDACIMNSETAHMGDLLLVWKELCNQGQEYNTPAASLTALDSSEFPDENELVTEESSSQPSTQPPPCDYKKDHSEARLCFGMLLENMNDAVKEGDGERLVRLYRVALLYYKAYGHTQYAYSTVLMLVRTLHSHHMKAHSLTWIRFFNSKGGKGRNISCNLHLEHVNNFLRSSLKGLGPNLTEQTASRISKSLGILKGVLGTTDEELGVAKPSGYHHSANKLGRLYI